MQFVNSWKVELESDGEYEWVSELLLLNANSANLQLYHGENKLIMSI
jgi:hypothetical protein